MRRTRAVKSFPYSWTLDIVSINDPVDPKFWMLAWCCLHEDRRRIAGVAIVDSADVERLAQRRAEWELRPTYVTVSNR
jgi:hypothetical protein